MGAMGMQTINTTPCHECNHPTTTCQCPSSIRPHTAQTPRETATQHAATYLHEAAQDAAIWAQHAQHQTTLGNYTDANKAIQHTINTLNNALADTQHIIHKTGATQ